jgi:D-xylose transport system ATP-binding protein
MDVAIRFQEVTKEFSGVRALSDVTFDVRAGEAHALCGENGAGKSTLIRLLGGVWPSGSYTGSIRLHGTVAQFRSVRDAERAGIAVIHQELALVPDMSAAENMLLGREPLRRGVVDFAAMRAAAAGAFDRLGASIDPSTPVRQLGVGGRQLVAIGAALLRDARILVLDEPTSALTESEAARLLAIVRSLRDSGVTVIYISHRLDEILAVADAVTVLRDGEHVGSWRAENVTQDGLVRAMVGRDVATTRPQSDARRIGVAPALEARSWGATTRGGARAVGDVSFEAWRGEVLGIAGLMGSGRTELLTSIFGAWQGRTEGSVLVDGRPAAIAEPRDAVDLGLALVAEDRRRQGLVLGMTVGHNLTLACLRELSRLGFISRPRDAAESTGLVERLGVRTRSIHTMVSALSGGNQQKVALGKWLPTQPSVLLLDEPTRGVDVGAKAEIHRLIRGIARDGAAVVVVSSEAQEIMTLSDRVMVMRRGTVAARFDELTGVTQDDILAAAIAETGGAGAA